MNICSHHHDEIVYEGRWCPLCQKQEELDAAVIEIDKLLEELLNK